MKRSLLKNKGKCKLIVVLFKVLMEALHWVHVHTSSCCAVPLLVQCRVCEYAGCIWIVVVIVVPMVTAIADSNNIEKTRIFSFPSIRI